jgi:8-oxo-dGTP pyrophosphatase MutT (NUDIX family)
VDARTIQLRRPPVLVRVEGRFVPPRVELAEVDRRWNALCAANPRCFDGSMLQVLGVSRNGHGGVQIHVQECSYRFYAVQKTGLDCGVRPIGVKAVTIAGGRVLMGRRSTTVAFYPGLWEFVPGGGLEPGVDPAQQIARELHEEAHLAPSAPAVAVALLFDPHAFTWEIVHRMELAAGAVPDAGRDGGWEYDEFRMVGLDGPVPEPLAPVAQQRLPIARRLLAGAQPRQ